MIAKIKSSKDLKNYIEDTCCENEICVSFDKKLQPNNYAIIKVDKYYADLHLAATPASIDCLIVQKCVNNGYGLTLVELKGIDKGKRFTVKNLKEKYETVLNDFISVRFKSLFKGDLKNVKLYFVSKQENHKRDMGLKMEMLINTKFTFRQNHYQIIPKMPNPTIKNCY